VHAATAYSEAGAIVRRLAEKLECRSVALVGYMRPELIGALDGLAVADVDSAEEIRRLPLPLAVLSVRRLLELDEPALHEILAAVPAAFVYDPDSAAGRGAAALLELAACARARGAQVLQADLIGRCGAITERRNGPAMLVGDGRDPRPEFLSATGFHGLRLDPHADPTALRRERRRICIVSYEFTGRSAMGGIGTANAALARALVSDGHDVTVIYTGPGCEPAQYARYQATFAQAGITFLEPAVDRLTAVHNPFSNHRIAWAALELIRTLHRLNPFDIIHGPESQGQLMYVALAKRHGIDFATAEIVSGLHGPVRYMDEANQRPTSHPESVATDLMERISVEATDVAIGPSTYLPAFMRSRGWRVPQRTFLQHHLQSKALQEMSAVPAPSGDLEEIVFFGNLVMNKGIETFCRALDLLAELDSPPALPVTFLGPARQIRGQGSVAYLEARAKRWPWPIHIVTELDHDGAVAYLRGRRCLAVMPSHIDNSPNTIAEVVALRIPCIVSRSGGVPEMIAWEDIGRCSFAGWAEDDERLEPLTPDLDPRPFHHGPLAELLLRRISDPGEPVRPRVDPELNESCYLTWHRSVRSVPAPAAAPRPAVSRISVHGPLPPGLKRAIDMLVTLDEPAGAPAAQWAASVDQDGTVAAACNRAADRATGDLLGFLPAGVVPRPEMEAVLAGAAARCTADVLLYAVGGPDGKTIVPTCGPAVLGLQFALYEGVGLAIRAESFRALGGFSVSDPARDPTPGLITRAELAGLRVEVIPTVLADVDQLPGGLNARYRTPAEQTERLRPFLRAAPALPDLPGLYGAIVHRT
jgi:glycosyltransferase involved in cell wall biosynthesis